MDEKKIEWVAQTIYGFGVQAEYLKTSAESEKRTRMLCMVESLFSFLNTLAVNAGIPMEQMLKVANFAPNVIESMCTKNFKAVLEIVEIEDLLKSTCFLVEGLLAQVDVLLKTVVLDKEKTLGFVPSTTSMISPLHNTVNDILEGLTGSIFGKTLGLVGDKLNEGVLSKIGGLKGGLLGR